MLVGNYSKLNSSPGRFFGGTLVGGGADRGNYGKPGSRRDAYVDVGTTWDSRSAIPEGYYPPYTWLLPQTQGGMVTRLAGSGSVTGTGQLTKQLAAALAGTGSISTSNMITVAAMLAALSGSGSISTSNLIAVLQLVVAMSGSGSLTSQAVPSPGHMASSLAGSGALTAVRYAVGEMEATINIGGVTYAEAADVAAAVWSASAALNNDVGTMGEKLNDAGGAANPWTEVIEGSYTAAEMLRIIAAALAGELSGAATTTITIQGIDGVTDRIIATVTSDGDRTAIALDGA